MQMVMNLQFALSVEQDDDGKWYVWGNLEKLSDGCSTRRIANTVMRVIHVAIPGISKLINELILHNKPFTMMAYPNRSHSIREGENTTLHLRSLLTRYLNQRLLKSLV